MRTAAICPTCATYENALCIIYNGAYLSNIDAVPLDSIEAILVKTNARVQILANKSIDGTFAANSDTLYPSQKAVKTYVTSVAATLQPLLGFTPENVANKSTDVTFAANSNTLYPTQAAVKAYITANSSAKISPYINNDILTVTSGNPVDSGKSFSVDGNFASNSDVLIPTQKATKTYVDASVSGLLDDRGNYTPSVSNPGTWPSTGGSGIGGAIRKGDLWYIAADGYLGTTAVVTGSNFRAIVDTPGQTAGNWNILNAGVGYIPENQNNKSTDGTMAANSVVLYPSQSAVVTYVSSFTSGAYLLLTGGTLTGSLTGKSAVFIDSNSNELVYFQNTSTDNASFGFVVAADAGIGASISSTTNTALVANSTSGNNASFGLGKVVIDNAGQIILGDPDDDNGVRIYDNGLVAVRGNFYSTLYHPNDTALTAYAEDGWSVRFGSGGIGLSIPSSNNVLIGTLTDDGTNKLQVTGNTKITGTLTSTGTITGTTGAVISGSAGFTVTPSGRTLIGTASDDGINKLQVTGSGELTGNLQANKISTINDFTHPTGWISAEALYANSEIFVDGDGQFNGDVTAASFTLETLNTAPSSSFDTGTLGEIRITAGYIYVCIATNTWVRAQLLTF